MGSRARQRTPAQSRRLWGLASRIAKASGGGKAEQEALARGAAEEVSGRRSTSSLTPAQARQAIALLEQRAKGSGPKAKTTKKAGPSDARWGPITPRQQAVIQALYRQVGMTDPARQRGFCERQCKTPWPQSQEDADRLMEPLKAMALRSAVPKDIWDRARAIQDSPRLDAWQAQFVPDLVAQFVEAEANGKLNKVLSPHKLLKLLEAEHSCGVAS